MMPIRHLVLMRFKDSAAADVVLRVTQDFLALCDRLDCVDAVEWGVNNSPEALAQGFTHGFTLTFASEAARAVYLPHPQHQAFVQQLQPLLADVLVFDYAL